MGCGTSKTSQPKPAPGRGTKGTAGGAPRAGGGGTAGQPPPGHSVRPYIDQNGMVIGHDRRLSLVSEGSEDELRCTELIQGNISMARDDTTRVIRVFTSSTFTDTRHERNALMERVYPKLKEFAAERGYDFQVVDMRWGIREQATNDHMTTEICLKELKACQRLSTGPNFVTFLSHKYGYRPLSRLINADQFELILTGVTDPKAKELLEKWYRRDDNAVPPSYVLQPISKNIPEFLSKDPDVFSKARDTWWEENDVMREALATASQQTLTDLIESHKFMQSVTETEIDIGILQASNVEEHCLWFNRVIEKIANQEPSRLLSRFKDCRGSEKAIEESKELLENLKENLITRKLPKDCIITYKVPWTEKGVDPTSCRQHAEYIDQLCSDFDMRLKGQIQAAIHKRNQSQSSNDPVTLEISQHALFCQSKVESFYGRQNMIDQVETYLVGSSRYPLVVHGHSGCGKTSVMAVAAQRAWELYKGKAIVILRFVGTTPDSSSIRTLLFSIISQIRRLFLDEKEVPTDMKSLVDEFYTVLHLASAEQPIVLILDSLDQFSAEHNARQLFWLPGKLPNHVKMLLSTLPGQEYECFPRLKMILQDDHHFVAVPQLTVGDVNGILSTWLEKSSRALRPAQRQAVVDAFSQCPLPLYLKLCFDEACRWPSFMEPSEARLETTIQDIIRSLFTRLEGSHGKLMVSRVLGYITISRSGLTETELEDVLSCDDDVLNDVYQFWTPPLRRLPPLLAIRIKADLSQYLVERGAEGVTVTYWYHRQFIEAARAMYCTDPAVCKVLHTNIAEYFRGIWAEKPKPYTDAKTGKEESAMRYVAKQPFKFDARFNLRKLMELPVHVIEAEQLTVLKDELLCNLRWLTAKIQATSLRHVLDDFNMARFKFPEEEDLKTVGEVLQLSQDALNQDPHQLPGQLIGRIAHGNNKLTAQCCRPPYPALIPSEVILTEPGGQLVHALSEHTNEVNALDLSQDGQFAVTCSDDHTVKVWDIKAGKLYKSIDNVGDQPSNVKFCCNDKSVVVVDSKHVYHISLETSEMKVIDEKTLKISGANTHKFLVFNEGSVMVVPVRKGLAFLELPSGTHDFTIRDQFLKARDSFGSFSDILDGHKNFVAITGSASSGSTLHYEVHIADVRQRQFIHSVSLFSKPKNEDDAEYTVDALAMTHDEKMVIAAEMLENNLHFISVETGEVVRKIDGNDKDSSDLFHITPDDSCLYFANIDHLCMWHLETGDRSYTLHHASRSSDIQTRDQRTYVSIAGDLVCIWDITRTDVHQPKTEESKDASPYSIRGMLALPHTDRYILIKKQPKTYPDDGSMTDQLCIYDVLQEEYIRRIKVPKANSLFYTTHDDRVIMKYDRTAIVINLNDYTHKVCQGKLPKYNSEIIPLKSKPWFVTMSRGNRKVKVYNWLTGKVEFLLGGGEDFKFDYLVASPQGNVAAAMGENWPVVVFDLVKRSVRHTIDLDKEIYSFMEMKISEDGSYLMQEVLRSDEEISAKLNYTLICDLGTGQVTQHQIDWDSHRAVEADHSDVDLGITTFCCVGSVVVSGHCDHLVRVWDANTGEKLQSLLFSRSEDVTGMSLSPDESRLMAIGDKGHMVLYDTTTWDNIASFKVDDQSLYQRNVLVGDGGLVLLHNEVNGKLTQLRLVGDGIKPKRDQRRLKEIYKPKPKLDEKALTFDIPDSESDDPDTDVDEVSSIGTTDDDVGDMDDDDEMFTMNSDIPALSQAKEFGDLEFSETSDLDLDPSDSDDDVGYDTKTKSTTLCDSIGMKSSAKSKASDV